jgi:hypothetical protein
MTILYRGRRTRSGFILWAPVTVIPTGELRSLQLEAEGSRQAHLFTNAMYPSSQCVASNLCGYVLVDAFPNPA